MKSLIVNHKMATILITILVTSVFLGLLACVHHFHKQSEDDFAFYRLKDGYIEKSVEVLGSDGSLIWRRVANQTIVNCSGSWPDPTWSKADYAAKVAKQKECRLIYGIIGEGKTWN